MSDKLHDFNGAENAYKVRYYETEACDEIKETIILCSSVKEASVYAEQLASSEYHILSVEEIGYAMIGKDKFKANIQRF